MYYYSKITCGEVTEIEAQMQILQLCQKWFKLTHPKGNFTKYCTKHSDLLDIDLWNCFEKLKQ
jgi:hypothetical protein